MTRSVSGRTTPLYAGIAACGLLLLTTVAAEGQSQQERTDAVFANYSVAGSPGCAVGVDRGGDPLLRSAYGMADLEWDMPITPETIFENGSVSKQFTAAAIALLALDGALSLEDDVRKYVPELPNYPETITLRHMLNHTSGLRDWGSVAGLSGWGRSLRTHDQRHVIDILSRQTALNFTPGHEYSYSNSGYNLLAIIVSRVSGMSFAEFSNTRIFEPLGMTNTQWRDDYTRIVPGRSAAYTARRDGTFSINRPIEHVHGNGGLLTTVGDLLTWNHALDEGSLAGPELVEMLETQGVLNDGRTIAYALGLSVGESFGLRTVSHGGATSGYRAGLVRFPDQQLSVAVLCNVTSANAVGHALDAAEVFLGDLTQADSDDDLPQGIQLSGDQLRAHIGPYSSTIRPARSILTFADGQLRIGGANGTVLTPWSETEFHIGAEGGPYLVFTGPVMGKRQGFELRYEGGVVDAFVPAGEWTSTEEALQEYTGTYKSEDAQVTMEVTLEEGGLVLVHPELGPARLRASHLDTFMLGGRLIRFRRLAGGAVYEMSIAEQRIYDMRFGKVH